MKELTIIISLVLLSFLLIPVISIAYFDVQQEVQIKEQQQKSASKINITGNKKSILMKKNNPEKFVPSEKIKADSSVSFPVDI